MGTSSVATSEELKSSRLAIVYALSFLPRVYSGTLRLSFDMIDKPAIISIVNRQFGIDFELSTSVVEHWFKEEPQFINDFFDELYYLKSGSEYDYTVKIGDTVIDKTYFTKYIVRGICKATNKLFVEFSNFYSLGSNTSPLTVYFDLEKLWLVKEAKLSELDEGQLFCLLRGSKEYKLHSKTRSHKNKRIYICHQNHKVVVFKPSKTVFKLLEVKC